MPWNPASDDALMHGKHFKHASRTYSGTSLFHRFFSCVPVHTILQRQKQQNQEKQCLGNSPDGSISQNQQKFILKEKLFIISGISLYRIIWKLLEVTLYSGTTFLTMKGMLVGQSFCTGVTSSSSSGYLVAGFEFVFAFALEHRREAISLQGSGALKKCDGPKQRKLNSINQKKKVNWDKIFNVQGLE